MWSLWLSAACVTEAPKASAPVSGPVAKAKSKAKAKAKAPAGPLAEVIKPAVRDPARWSQARCNDGTPAGLLVRKPEAGSTTWVVKVAGGFFCEDEKVPCGGREARLTTTLKGDDGAKVEIGRQGLFSLDAAQNPTFASANHVSLGYCSSDLWLGASTERQPTPAAADGWYFSGRHNFRAAIESLTAQMGLDDSNPDTSVLLVGHSAGGAGVVGNLDVVQELLPGVVGRGKLKVLLDGSWIPTQPVDKLPTADKWGPVHPTCDKEVPDGRTCVYGPTWWPYVEKTGIPVLVAISAIDVTQTRVFLPERTAEAAEAWRKNTLASLEGLPWVFSEGRAYHVLSFEPGFHNGPAEGPKFSELVTRFWEGGTPTRVLFGYDLPVKVPAAGEPEAEP